MSTVDYLQMGNEMMRQLQRLEIKSNQAGEILVSLLEMAETFRKTGKWQQAIECCGYGLDMTGEKWIHGIDISPNYAKGLASAWLATTYLSKGNIQVAVDHYEDAADYFRSDTNSRTQEESIVRLILSKIYVHDKQWGKALGAAQHSLNAFSDKFIVTKKDEKTLELIRNIKAEVENVKEQLNDHLTKLEDNATVYVKRETTYLPIYKDKIEKTNVIGELALDKKFTYGAEFIFQTNDKNSINPDIKRGDLVLIRPWSPGKKKEIALITCYDISISRDDTPSFMYLITEENHFYLASPPATGSNPLIVVVLEPHIDREEIETIYASRKTKPNYVKRQDIRIHGKVAGMLRQMTEEIVE